MNVRQDTRPGIKSLAKIHRRSFSVGCLGFMLVRWNELLARFLFSYIN